MPDITIRPPQKEWDKLTEAEKTELIALQTLQENLIGKELTALIVAPTPRRAIFERPIRGGGKANYVPVYYMIDRLNALFGFNWDFIINDKGIETEEGQVWVNGTLTARVCVNGDWISISKSNFGGSDIKFYAHDSPKEGGYKGGDMMDLADDLKSAASDCLKKCATMFGIANDVYGRREISEVVSLKHSQISAIFMAGKANNKDEDAVRKMCHTRFDVDVEELNNTQYMELIREVRGTAPVKLTPRIKASPPK